jgi:chromate transporter
MVGAIAWAYVRYGALPQAAGLLYGVKPVVIAVVLQALWGLGRSAVKSRTLAALGGGAVIAAGLGAHELAVLGAVGAGAALLHRARASRPDAPDGPRSPGGGAAAAGWLAGAPVAQTAVVATSGAAAAATAVGLAALFGVFAKIGAVLFGSGYVLLAFLRADLVQRLGWLTERQLLDAVAVGQVTPGPVFTTATFVGYVLGGLPGAAAATVGIFLPAFVFVAVSGPLVPRVRRSPTAGAVLDGVNVASLALMAVVAVQLGRAALVDPLTVALAACSAVLLLRFRVNSAWLVLGGATIGLLVGTPGGALEGTVGQA